MRARNTRIGPAAVLQWTAGLPPGCAILDIGCGHGVPISEALIAAGFELYGVDASPTLLAAFRERFSMAHAECSAAEDSNFFGRAFEAAIAWGLLFLLPAEVQPVVIHRVAGALIPGGRFLFTAPADPISWMDSLTDRESVSLGRPAYERILAEAGLAVVGNASDEGDNFYYFTERRPRA